MELLSLPLFPLGSVLYPAGVLPLRIFEVRYLDMIGKCIQTGAPFGVLTQSSVDVMSAIEDGEIDAPDEVLDQFAGAQEQLNALLAQRAGNRPLVDGCLDVAQRLAAEVGGLRRRNAS